MIKLLRQTAVLLFIIHMLFPVSAFAACERITTSDVVVETDRLFEVKVGFKSSRTIAAASFKISYNPDEIAARQPVCNLSGAKLKFVNENGVSQIIFLYSDGVKCSEFPTLFTMKYKKLGDENTKVRIEASDCVDNNLRNFTPPRSVVCNIKSENKSRAEGKSGGDSGGFDVYEDSDDADNDDVLETSGKSDYAENREDGVKLFSGDDSPVYLKFLPAIIIFVLLIFAALIMYQNIQLKRAEKQRREDEQTKQSKKD